MFKFQLGRAASEADKALIVAFLQSLTGEAIEKQNEAPKTEKAEKDE
ncbi:MAG: Unknown protein [uncultured Thiotrichaceae bacterium]|uniref:Uncharacterized protein n=1 Tax=uncultured Thiotrichaceae bacterium TaxID=298394 RepID=A0A6S6SZC3_9GAMM|nr:MAG: Unknown protein [uncultured Thiotrichaceae bacterium]